jgi:leucyl aminopeptidase
MKISVKKGEIGREEAEIGVLGLFEGEELPRAWEGLDQALQGEISRLLKSGEFKAKLSQTHLLHTLGKLPTRRLLLLGLGKKEEWELDALRKAAGKAATVIRSLGIDRFQIPLLGGGVKGLSPEERAQAMAEGALLGLYRYTKYKTSEEAKEEERKEIQEITLLTRGEQGIPRAVRRGKILAEATAYVRDLANAPGNEGTPTHLSRVASRLAKEKGLKCRVLKREEMKKEGMGALLGVSQGSAQPPTFTVLEYPGRGGETVVVVGKAITFDSGGISLKPGEKMEEMKFDKAGGCAVLGILKAVGELRLSHRVVGLIPATENLPGGKAYKPGDVLTASSGKTIEVVNTDAEGRLILADALVYAKRYKPAVIIDLATLTGACVIALGSHATGMMGNDEALKARLRAAGEKSGERVWELPLWKEYEEQIKSDVADIKNVGGKEGGAITAAAFLKNFVDETPWIHLDIAGTAWTTKEKPYTPKGATGVGVRLVLQLLLDWGKGA